MLNFSLISPEIFLLSMTCVILLVDLFIPQRQQLITYALTQITLVGALLLTVLLYATQTQVIFYGMIVHDQLASILKIVIYITSIFVFLYSRDYLYQNNMRGGEPYLLGLFSILGMQVLVSAHNFVTLYLGVELMSLPIYALVALRRDSEMASEAAMKYFVLGALSSGMLLYGLSLLYGATGTMDLGHVMEAISNIDPTHRLILIFGLVFVVAGLAFKIGVVPFHMWLPDVYSGAPNAATLFIAVAPKVAAFGLLVRLLINALPELQGQWQQLLIIMAVLSLILGNLVAIVQSNIKRMLAYSTIAHGGYMLLGFAAATPAGYAAAMFYTIVYAVMSLGGFGFITLLAKQGLAMESISDLRGLNQRNPGLALLMLIFLFSMAGIPPTVGFFAKFSILVALVDSHLIWLAAFPLIMSVIGVYYYINLVKVMYFDQSNNEQKISLPLDTRIALSINGMAILYLGIFPNGLIQLCSKVFLH